MKKEAGEGALRFIEKKGMEKLFVREVLKEIPIMESLILAQNERWRRVLSMQVEWEGELALWNMADW